MDDPKGVGPFESIAHVVSRHARNVPARDAIIFLERGETETGRLTYAQLDARAASYASGLEAQGLAGRAIAIAMPPGLDFVALFLGTLRAGAIAVPLPYPDSDRSTQRIAAILADARPAAIITDPGAVAKLDTGLRVLAHDALEGSPTRDFAIEAQHPALIQYTSGSTRAPKGIVISHANLMANQRMIQRAFGLEGHRHGVTWLPHFHDMGLIGTILQPLYFASTAVIMPPRAFIQKPLRWLKAIERYGAHTMGAPCFGYELCVRTVPAEETKKLDLSSWKVAFCGAEPIRAQVLQAFAERFADAGFDANAFLPCYGLAETTLITTATAPGSGVREREIGGRRFVSCGAPVEESALFLRAENEICVAGPHLSLGLWDGARQAITPFPNLVEKDGRTYLPTGDAGALIDGELFVVDRLKDMLVLYGAKIHAGDVEAEALDHDAGIRAAAAFAIDDGRRERLVLLCEIDRRRLATDGAALEAALAKRVAQAQGVVPIVRLVAYGALPRTSSGKVQRFAARTKFLSGGWGVPNVETGAALPQPLDE
jgi:acyl-CoA synthetase (AMP-forming)/AMP-acid ligase II